MTDLARVTVNLTGWDGAPGVNVLHFSPGTTTSWSTEVVTGMCDEIVGMHEGLKSMWAPGIQIQLREAVDIIDSASGDIINQVIPDPPFGPITSTGSDGKENRASQAVIRFGTSDFRDGRRIQGRMFLGPISGAVLGTDGLVTDDTLAAVPDEFTAMISGVGPRLCIYTRPKASPFSEGNWADVTSVSVSKIPGILRKRRA